MRNKRSLSAVEIAEISIIPCIMNTALKYRYYALGFDPVLEIINKQQIYRHSCSFWYDIVTRTVADLPGKAERELLLGG